MSKRVNYYSNRHSIFPELLVKKVPLSLVFIDFKPSIGKRRDENCLEVVFKNKNSSIESRNMLTCSFTCSSCLGDLAFMSVSTFSVGITFNIESTTGQLINGWTLTYGKNSTESCSTTSSSASSPLRIGELAAFLKLRMKSSFL